MLSPELITVIGPFYTKAGKKGGRLQPAGQLIANQSVAAVVLSGYSFGVDCVYDCQQEADPLLLSCRKTAAACGVNSPE
jgi:hypothetical protein